MGQADTPDEDIRDEDGCCGGPRKKSYILLAVDVDADDIRMAPQYERWMDAMATNNFSLLTRKLSKRERKKERDKHRCSHELGILTHGQIFPFSFFFFLFLQYLCPNLHDVRHDTSDDFFARILRLSCLLKKGPLLSRCSLALGRQSDRREPARERYRSRQHVQAIYQIATTPIGSINL